MTTIADVIKSTERDCRVLHTVLAGVCATARVMNALGTRDREYVVAVIPPGPSGTGTDVADIVMANGRSVTTANPSMHHLATSAMRAELPVTVETLDDGITVRSMELHASKGPTGRRPPVHVGLDLQDVIEQIATLLHRATWLQAGMADPMPPLESLSPNVRGTFRRGAVVAVRKFSVMAMTDAQSRLQPTYPTVPVLKVATAVDDILAQELV